MFDLKLSIATEIALGQNRLLQRLATYFRRSIRGCSLTLQFTVFCLANLQQPYLS